jgi:hypothetical protein
MSRPSFWQRLLLLWRYLRSQEPARVIAFWRALLGVAIAAGFTIPEWLDARVAGVIAAVYVVLALWQGESTRARVVPADNVPAQMYADSKRQQPPTP